MTCKEMEYLLPGMIDGALPETDKKRSEAHLETCAFCRKTFADLRMANERVKSLEEVEPPPWLKTRVMARVRAETGQKEGILRKLFYPLHIKVPIQALATVLIAVVAWNVYKTGEPEFRQMAPSTTVQQAPQVQAPPEPGPAAGPAKRDESPAAREKKAFAPPAAPRQEPAPQRTATVHEETTADAEKPAEPLRAAKRAAGPPKDEDAPRGTGAARPGEADRALEARDQKQKAAKAPVGAVAKEAGKQEAQPAEGPMLSAAVPSRPDMEITLRARDPASAAAEAESLLSQLNAKTIDRQTREGQVILTARIKTERLEALRESLKSLGLVQESFHVAPRPGGSLTIRIEIRPD